MAPKTNRTVSNNGRKLYAQRHSKHPVNYKTNTYIDTYVKMLLARLKMAPASFTPDYT
jgi:hypothetical protein